MKTYKFEFSGKGFEYLLYTLGWAVLIGITLGIAFPFYVVWNFNWFVTKLKIVQE